VQLQTGPVIDIIVDEDFLDLMFTRVNKRKANGMSGNGYGMWHWVYKSNNLLS
jgi:hypothetical protein